MVFVAVEVISKSGTAAENPGATAFHLQKPFFRALTGSGDIKALTVFKWRCPDTHMISSDGLKFRNQIRQGYGILRIEPPTHSELGAVTSTVDRYVCGDDHELSCRVPSASSFLSQAQRA